MSAEYKYLVPVNLSGNELRNALMQSLSAAPAGVAGLFYYDTTTNKPFYYNGTDWTAFGTTSGALIFKGGFDASTGAYPANPTLGDFYKVTVAGTVDTTDLSVGDDIFYDGSAWNKIGGGSGSSANAVTLTGDQTIDGTKTFTSQLFISTPTGINPALKLMAPEAGRVNYLQGAIAGKARWGIALGDGAAESGSNVGSDFKIDTYNDDGSYNASVLYITRSTGALTLNSTLSVTGPTTSAAIGTVGFQLNVPNNSSNPVTDTGTAANGTLTYANCVSLQQATINAANTGVTYTDAATLFIGAGPAAGTNVTITNGWALRVNSGNSFFGGDITVGGNITAASTSTLSFGSSTRQIINLYGASYGIGIQSNTQYYRAGSGYAWFQGGTHSDTQNDPGAGGTLLMSLSSGDLTVNAGKRMIAGAFQSNQTANAPQSNPQAAAFRAQGSYGGGFGMTDGSYGITLYSTTGNLCFGFGTNTSVTQQATINADGAGNFTRVYAGYDSGVVGSVSCSQWFRSTGNTGWYNSTYAVGVYAIDTTYLRSYNNKAMVASDFVISSDESLKANITPLEYRGRLEPIIYVMKATGQIEIGFGAGATEKVYPELVNRDPTDGTLKLKYPRVAAVLSAQLNALEDKVARLEELLARALAQQS